MKVDVLPDINKPTVSVFTEGEGMAAEEVEQLILGQVESAVAGAPGVTRIRSTASFGLAIVNAEFEWGTDIYRNRQIIQERLANLQLPGGARPVLGPVSSIMGEIMWAGLTDETLKTSPMELRGIADWTIRPALLRVPGVSDVIVMGGDVKEWQVNLNASQMKKADLKTEDVVRALEASLNNKSGGILVQSGKEYPIRIMISPSQVSELEEIIIQSDEGRATRLGNIAQLVEGPSPIRGAASVDGKPGVLLRIAKQPDAETLEVTRLVDEALSGLQNSLPQGVKLENDLFRQEWFINSGLKNVIDALRDGIFFVIIVLILFLMNVRVTLITLTAIPLSILVTAIIFRYMDFSVNVMTLGGIAVAIGELVDDAIVDVENVHRKLKVWRATGMKEPVMQVVYQASREVRNSIVYATLLVAIVFLPLFFLPGVEGRLLASLGAAYLISLIASLFVSLTVTPAMSMVMLGSKSEKMSNEEKNAALHHEEDTKFVRALKRRMSPLILQSIKKSNYLIWVTVFAVLGSTLLFMLAGREGIPPFNEGSATITAVLPVGTDLNTSNRFATRIENDIKSIEGVARVSHLTGRAGADPHDSGANTSEIQVTFQQGLEHETEEFFEKIQEVLEKYPGADYSIGQPITHRVEELLSGVRAPIVVKIFGDDLQQMRDTAEVIRTEFAKNPDVKNPQVQKEVLVPEFRIYADKAQLANYKVSASELAEELEQGLLGAQVGQVQIGAERTNVVVRYDQVSKGNAYALRDLSLPFEGIDSLSGGATTIKLEGGRNKFSHEGGKRTLTVTANYQGSDIVGAVENVKTVMDGKQLPLGLTLSYEGTYQSSKENTTRLAIMFAVGLFFIFAILYKAFKSARIASLIMLNIPTVAIGGVAAVYLTGGVINIAHTVGFISLAGIVSRNGIILVSRCIQMIKEEGQPFTPETIRSATLDRVVPVLMTALVAALALIPLMLAGKEPGKELLNPLANVIFGGLMSSTIISLFLTPALFYKFGRPVFTDEPSRFDRYISKMKRSFRGRMRNPFKKR
jgi:CzcA family heavy metal efflux pump